MSYVFHNKLIIRTPFKAFKSKFSIDEIKEAIRSKEIQEAVYLASPDLFEECNKWLRRTENNEDDEKLIFSLLKYLSRMHQRCTPFGLFAGCSSGDWNNSYLLEKEISYKKTRLDMHFTCSLAQDLAKRDYIKPYLKYKVNNTLYKVHKTKRYVEYLSQNDRRIYFLASVDDSRYLNKVIKVLEAEPLTRRELAECIVDENVNLDEAGGFISELIDGQILVSILEPSVIGNDHLDQILNSLKSIEPKDNSDAELKQIMDTLKKIQDKITDLDQNIGNDILFYTELCEIIETLQVPFKRNKIFQTDLFENIKAGVLPGTDDQESVTEKNKKRLLGAIAILNKLRRPASASVQLENFKTRFSARFGNREVPLIEVLDNEIGIGYGRITNDFGETSPLLNGVSFPIIVGDENNIVWNRTESFLLKKLLKAQINNDYSVEISMDELSDFKEEWDNLPASLDVMFSASGATMEDQIVLKSVSSHAVKLLGRFGYGDEGIFDVIKTITNHEKHLEPNSIFAEIVHLPENRTGNVIMRPNYRDYQIPYLANPTLPDDKQIPIDDLFVTVSNNTIILKSRRLNKVVIPRLDNAHNYRSRALPFYEFLCDLQFQNIRGGFIFGWGSLAKEFKFLPRVETNEKIILSSAQWNFNKSEIKEIESAYDSNYPAVECKRLIEEFRRSTKLPQLVTLVDGDNELFINFEDELSIKMFLNTIKKRSSITLKEFLDLDKVGLIADNHGGKYTNEFIAVLLKEPTQPVLNIASSIELKKSEPQRFFSVGSEWLYYKFYCGIKTADKVLVNILKPLVKRLTRLKLIDSWFFIRYNDPDVHLRIRFHVINPAEIGRVIGEVENAVRYYQKNGLIWKTQIDMYEREIERYNGSIIVEAEKLFAADSSAVLDFLDLIDLDSTEGDEIRWLFAIKSVDDLLNSFNSDLTYKRKIIENLKSGYSTEFGMNKTLKVQLDTKFRAQREAIFNFFRDMESIENIDLLRILKQRNSKLKPIVFEMREKTRNNSTIDFDLLLNSYIHMSLNRIFKSKARQQELIVYYFMDKFYESLSKRKDSLLNRQKSS